MFERTRYAMSCKGTKLNQEIGAPLSWPPPPRVRAIMLVSIMQTESILPEGECGLWSFRKLERQICLNFPFCTPWHFVKQDSKPACLANCCFQHRGILFLTDKIEVNGTENSAPQPPAKSADKGSLAVFQGSTRWGSRVKWGVAGFWGWFNLVLLCSFWK